MLQQIKSRWSGGVVFECEIDATAETPLGVRLGLAVRIAVGKRAVLSGAVLRDAVLSGAVLSGAVLRDADLRDADLSGAVLRDAVLSGAVLSGADWLPRIPKIHQSVYAAASQPGALNMGSWHENGYCGTTHCRAGWVCALAGPAGRVLEGIYGTNAAAALIYAASDPALDRTPNWFASNADALADMKAMAEAEAEAARTTV